MLGLDETAVLDALSRHWQRNEDINREYLEKLFQARVPVPLPQKSSVTALIKNQLRKEIHNQLADAMADEIEALLEPNPRKVKNFVNGLIAQWRILNASSWINRNDKSEACRFVLFFYIQQYHRAIWRLLERQQGALCYLNAVVNDKTINEIPKNLGNLHTEQQTLLMEMFRRALSHVLSDKQSADEENDKHGLQSLDDAVAAFINRQDRKRSDEYMIEMFKELISEDYALNVNYLTVSSTSQT